MDLQQKGIAEDCMIRSHEGTADFPAVLSALMAAGFEGYLVDYRKGSTTYYLSDGDNVEFSSHQIPGVIAPEFRAEIVEANVRKSQTNAHTYKEFCENVMSAGCAGYIVSLLGKRVTYFGRTGETHTETFPA
jgi:uncharacterized protein YbcV (DUF1398 family)